MNRIDPKSPNSASRVQVETGETVEIAYVDQGYTGENATDAAEEHGIKLEIVKLPAAKRGFVLLPRRWVIERSFGWVTRSPIWKKSLATHSVLV